MTASTNILLTVTGPDKPGITAALTDILSKYETDNHIALKDIEQVVVAGKLILCLSIVINNFNSLESPILKDLLYAATLRGQKLDFEIVNYLEGNNQKNKILKTRKPKYILTLLGQPIDSKSIKLVSSILSLHGANIDSIKRLSQFDLNSLEISISLNQRRESAERLKEDLMGGLSSSQVDIALQRENLTRRSKRLIVMDIDSTLISCEVIDELARYNNNFKEVEEITHRAMGGELDFDESLRARVSLLKNIKREELIELANNLPLTNGAEKLIKILKKLGYKIAVISGGFMFAAEKLKERLDLDYAYANILEIKNNLLTGKITGEIVNAERKANLLEKIAKLENIDLEQVIAIGDGANDAHMLAKAGLGIAFYAKPALRAKADMSLNFGGLERILYLLGIKDDEIDEMA